MPNIRVAFPTARAGARILVTLEFDGSDWKLTVADNGRGMSPAVLAYRGLTDARDRLLAWLAARAAGQEMLDAVPCSVDGLFGGHDVEQRLAHQHGRHRSLILRPMRDRASARSE